MFKQGFHQKGICEFIWKLREMIAKYSDTINWTEDGKQVVVYDYNRLQENVLPWFFRHSNFTSFVRQLNMYGFGKTLKENETLKFRHEVFTRGNDINYPLIQRKTKPRAQKKIEVKFQKENYRILQKINANIAMSLTVKETLVGLLEYKDRISDNLKKMKRMLEKICYELKDTRLKKVITCVEELKTEYIKKLENQISEAKQIQNFIETKIQLEQKRSSGKTPAEINPKKDKKFQISHFNSDEFLNFEDDDNVSIMDHREINEDEISSGRQNFGRQEIQAEEESSVKEDYNEEEVNFDFN